MKPFKSFFIQPLLAVRDLPLNSDDYHEFNLSEELEKVPLESRDELSNKILKLISTSNKAIVTAGYGENKFVSVNFRASNSQKKQYSFPEPNPIHLYLSVAVHHLYQAANLKNDIYNQESIDNAENYERFCIFSENIIAGVVFLTMVLEAFMNYMIDEDVSYTIDGKTQIKKNIEWLDFRDKFNKGMPVISGINFKSLYPKEDGLINNLSELRNDLVHLKKNSLANFTFYQVIYKKLLDFKPHENYDAVLLYMNTIQPGFVSIKE